MNLANAKVAQVLIPISDFDKGVAFYRDTLGVPHLFSAPPQMAFFNCGGVRLLVGVLPGGLAAQRGSAIYFQVPDIHAVHASLSANGSPVQGRASRRAPHAAVAALAGRVHGSRRQSAGTDERDSCMIQIEPIGYVEWSRELMREYWYLA